MIPVIPLPNYHFLFCLSFKKYLNDGGMLKKSRVTHKSNVIYLQFKLLPAHVRFGGQDGGQDDVGKPSERKKHKQQSETCAGQGERARRMITISF